VEAALKAIVPEVGAGPFQAQVADVLRGLGFKVTWELPVAVKEEGRRIDLLASRDGFLLAVELDRATPRKKTVAKLSSLPAAFRLVLLRKAAGEFPAPEGVDRVIGLAPQRRDLFGQPAEPLVPKRQRGPRKGAASVAATTAAVVLVDLYETLLQPMHPRTERSDKNAAHWLTHGYTAEQLTTAVRNYAEFCTTAGRLPEYRKSSANFFGARDPEFKAFLLRGTTDATRTAGRRPEEACRSHHRDPAEYANRPRTLADHLARAAQNGMGGAAGADR
jgi:hypothetical protein